MFSYWYKSPYAMLGKLLAKVGVIVQTIFSDSMKLFFFKFRKKINILSWHRLSNNPLMPKQIPSHARYHFQFSFGLILWTILLCVSS